ncbi:MAG TPA: YbhB/YbcL family Raf kinase inhibitor-like protein [Steroidobacteraceae bacterium]
MRFNQLVWPLVSIAALLAGCEPQHVQQQVTASLQVSSSTMNSGALPVKCGCNGEGSSPQLSWGDPPAGTQSFALLMDDRDAVVGHLHRHYFVHWLAFDMPPERRELTEALTREALPDGSQQGTNDTGATGYAGPCPDPGAAHHYAFTIYALDTKLGLSPTARGSALLRAADGHILARGAVIGSYQR